MPEYTEILLKSAHNRKDLSSRCSRQWYEVSLPTNLPDNFSLVFQNYYTASISVSQDTLDGSKVLLDNFRLMECAHNEIDAQIWHQFSSEEFKHKVNINKPLKINIYQPSSCWAKFELRNFKVIFGGDEKSYSANSNRDAGDTISASILMDWRIISEASFSQSKLRDLPEIHYQGGNEGRRTGKRSRRKERRVSTVTAGGLATPDVPNSSNSLHGKI